MFIGLQGTIYHAILTNSEMILVFIITIYINYYLILLTELYFNHYLSLFFSAEIDPLVASLNMH